MKGFLQNRGRGSENLPVMVRHQESRGWKFWSPSAWVNVETVVLPDLRRTGATPSKGAATGGERGAHSQTGMETEGQEAQDAIQRGQASLSRHRIEDGWAEI